MSSLFDSLTDKDVQVIDRLVDALNDSAFDFLELRLGETQLSIGKGTAPADPASIPAAAPAAVPAAATAVSTAQKSPEVANTEQESQPQDTPAEPDIEPGTVAITAPTVGRFYARPEPTADPYVTVGATVEQGETIGLVEVMKLFNSVDSEVSGTVSQILVEDGALVEYGQVLMTIKPSGTD